MFVFYLLFVNEIIDYYANYANFNWHVNILIILHILTYGSEENNHYQFVGDHYTVGKEKEWKN